MTAAEEVCEIVITAPDAQWIKDFTTYLITERLVACGHQQMIESTYTWQGTVHNATETRVALHTRATLFDRIAALATERHPYDVPCIIALPITHASPEYATWILNNTVNEPAMHRPDQPKASAEPGLPR